MVFGGINHWQHLKAFIQSCKCELLEHIPSFMVWDGKDASLWSLCFCWTLLKEAQWSGMFEVVNLEGESLDLVSLNCTRDQRPTHHLLCCHSWGCPVSQVALFGTVGVCPIGYSGRGGGISSISGCYSGLTEKVWSVLE